MTDNDERLTGIDSEAERQVTEALKALGEVEPPPGFVGQVMWQTAHRRRLSAAARQAPRRATLAKKVLLGVAAAAAVVLAVVWYAGFPTVSHTAGAIGAAPRYSGHVEPRDIQVSDPELQRLLQSDGFDRLIHDKQASAALQKVLSNPSSVTQLKQALDAADESQH